MFGDKRLLKTSASLITLLRKHILQIPENPIFIKSTHTPQADRRLEKKVTDCQYFSMFFFCILEQRTLAFKKKDFVVETETVDFSGSLIYS